MARLIDTGKTHGLNPDPIYDVVLDNGATISNVANGYIDSSVQRFILVSVNPDGTTSHTQCGINDAAREIAEAFGRLA